jgi:hypothetical protein
MNRSVLHDIDSHGPSARRGLYTSQKRSIEHFGPMLCSCLFSYSKRPSIAIRPTGPQVTANCLDQRSASPQFKQPSSTSTVSLSTASLSTSTTKSDARTNWGSTPPQDASKASSVHRSAIVATTSLRFALGYHLAPLWGKRPSFATWVPSATRGSVGAGDGGEGHAG